MMKILDRAFSWLLIAPVILPVVIWGGFIYPYLVPKTLLFYALTLLAIAVFVILVTHGKKFFWTRLAQWEAWVPGALLVLAYVASWRGIDFYRSFWSLFVRGDGLLMLTCAVASFYLILLSADEKFYQRLFRAVAVVASFVALSGVGEWLMSGGRIGGLLGNAAFFAGYLGVALFATLLAAAGLSGWWRRAALGGAALQVIAVILSATRGTILALGLALVASLAYFSFKKSKAAQVALGLLIILGASFFALRAELAKVPFEPIARIATISTADPDVASRLFIWKNMLSEIQKASLLGIGAEHIDVLFNRFYDPMQISEQWFDRSHNAFIDYAAQYGVGGLLLYLALIGSFFNIAAREARRGDRSRALLIGLLALTYAVQNFFVFDTISSFWLLLAVLAALLAHSQKSVAPEALSFPLWTRGLSYLVALMLLTFIGTTSIRPALAAADLMEAYKYQLTDPTKEVSDLSHGVALLTYADVEYGYEAYDMYTNVQNAALTGAAKVNAYQAARSILTNNFNRYPYDARTALYLAQILSIAPSGVSIDEGVLSSALERAIILSPKRYQSWYVLANLSISQANAYPAKSPERAAGYAAAHDILTKYISLVPKLAQPYFVLAQLEYASGDAATAATTAAKGKAAYVSDLETAKRAAVYYETVRDLPNAAFFLTEVVRLEPGNTAAAGDLEKIKTYEQSQH